MRRRAAAARVVGAAAAIDAAAAAAVHTGGIGVCHTCHLRGPGGACLEVGGDSYQCVCSDGWRSAASRQHAGPARCLATCALLAAEDCREPADELCGEGVVDSSGCDFERCCRGGVGRNGATAAPIGGGGDWRALAPVSFAVPWDWLVKYHIDVQKDIADIIHLGDPTNRAQQRTTGRLTILTVEMCNPEYHVCIAKPWARVLVARQPMKKPGHVDTYLRVTFGLRLGKDGLDVQKANDRISACIAQTVDGTEAECSLVPDYHVCVPHAGSSSGAYMSSNGVYIDDGSDTCSEWTGTGGGVRGLMSKWTPSAQSAAAGMALLFLCAVMAAMCWAAAWFLRRQQEREAAAPPPGLAVKSLGPPRPAPLDMSGSGLSPQSLAWRSFRPDETARQGTRSPGGRLSPRHSPRRVPRSSSRSPRHGSRSPGGRRPRGAHTHEQIDIHSTPPDSPQRLLVVSPDGLQPATAAGKRAAAAAAGRTTTGVSVSHDVSLRDDTGGSLPIDEPDDSPVGEHAAVMPPPSVDFMLRRKVGEKLGITWVDHTVIDGVLRNSLAERQGLADFVGWRAMRVNGYPVRTLGQIQKCIQGETTICLTLLKQTE